MIRSIWKYISLAKYIHKFYIKVHVCLPRESDIHEFVNQLIPLIQNCGCVCIKFCQWITPILDTLYNERDKHPAWLSTLERFYENCPEHSMTHTETLYKQDFGHNFSDTYELIDIIGSGSIGQVYKIKHRFTNQYFAMKVLHPQVRYDMWVFKIIIYILLKIPYTQRIIYDVLPYDIPAFLNLFEGQLDMVKEGNNLSYMNYQYKDNSKIHIPTCIQCSSNILIMTYEEGETIDDMDISEYEKMKLVTIFSLFTKHNLEIINFNHGDIHKGNWKIQPYNDTYRIIVYDCGFCWSVKNIRIINTLQEAFDETTNDDFHKLAILTGELLNDTSEYMLSIIYTYIRCAISENTTENIAEPQFTFKAICNIAKKTHITIDPVSIQLIIICLQSYKYMSTYGINNVNEQWATSKNIYRSDYLNSYTICKTYNIFPELQQQCKDKLNNKQVEVTELFDMLDESSTITDEVRGLDRKSVV